MNELSQLFIFCYVSVEVFFYYLIFQKTIFILHELYKF